MMTKKHYIQIAKILNKNNYNTQEHFNKIVNDLIEYFKTDNPLFDINKFRQAVYKD